MQQMRQMQTQMLQEQLARLVRMNRTTQLQRPRQGEPLQLQLFRPHRNEMIIIAQDMPYIDPGADRVLQAKGVRNNTKPLTQSQEAYLWPHTTTHT